MTLDLDGNPCTKAERLKQETELRAFANMLHNRYAEEYRQALIVMRANKLAQAQEEIHLDSRDDIAEHKRQNREYQPTNK